MVIVGRAYEADHTMAFNTDNAKRAFELLMDAGHEVWLSSGVLKAPIMRGQPLPRFDLPTRITPTDKKNQLSRNAACSCGSGLRYKACCGKMS